MQDVVRGVERARAWPRPKGSNQTPAQLEQQEWFRQANWAFKYADSKVQASCRKATHRTSLYPRDFFTMMAKGKVFTLLDENNYRIWPLAYVLDVSASLDAITQIPGQMLVREADRWRGIPVPVIPPGGGWTVVLDQLIAAPTAELTADVSSYSETMVTFANVTASSSGRRAIQVSTDGGATYWNTSGDYSFITTAGVTANDSKVIAHATNSTAARSGRVQIQGSSLTLSPKTIITSDNNPTAFFNAHADPITNVRAFNEAGNMTGGRVVIMGR